MKGTTRTFQLPTRFFLISQHSSPPFQWLHGVVKRQWTWEAARFLRREGYAIDCGPRSVQSFWSYLYFKLYIILRYYAFWLAYRGGGTPAMMKMVERRNCG
jgi:hypothetical protein